MKTIIFDASTLISFAMNGLLSELRGLRAGFDGKFIITKAVKKEAIDRPITIKRFELQAMQLKALFLDKVLELPSSLNVDDKLIEEDAKEIMNSANQIFYGKNRNIEIIHLGESECVALAKILKDRGIPNLLAIDERTMRMLCEKPENLRELLERKLHTKITVKRSPRKILSGCKVIRSTELAYMAYKKGLITLKGNMVLDALLYAMKFKGCSISEGEIQEIKSLDIRASK
ncbi:hypothetical protein KAR91_63230 [Candidatus Pacearchaeota archaeon]|nr:hypothetical protein [Candidatus Pacearchaeota archaeon]